MSNCKYIKQEYNYTPSDYNLNFTYQDIPLNINYEGATDIETSLNKTLPLTKTLHLTMNTTTETTINSYRIKTSTKWRQ